MPMKRSGRSVDDAKRVIEIDEVLEPMIASGLSTGQTLAKIVRFTSSFSVAAAEGLEAVRRRDAFERRLAFLLGDALAADLARHVAVDGGDPGLHPIGR